MKKKLTLLILTFFCLVSAKNNAFVFEHSKSFVDEKGNIVIPVTLADDTATIVSIQASCSCYNGYEVNDGEIKVYLKNSFFYNSENYNANLLITYSSNDNIFNEVYNIKGKKPEYGLSVLGNKGSFALNSEKISFFVSFDYEPRELSLFGLPEGLEYKVVKINEEIYKVDIILNSAEGVLVDDLYEFYFGESDKSKLTRLRFKFFK